MSKVIQIKEQIENTVYETNNYSYLMQQIPCVYARNAIFNMIRARLDYINFLANQLNDNIFLDESTVSGSTKSGIKQLTQGIQPSGLQNIASIPEQTSVPAQIGIPAQAGQVNHAVFTKEQLSRYNGKNGSPAYVAVNGVVYDVTSSAAWAAATHFGLVAGRDLTQEFASCHAGLDILSRLKAVGRLVQ